MKRSTGCPLTVPMIALGVAALMAICGCSQTMDGDDGGCPDGSVPSGDGCIRIRDGGFKPDAGSGDGGDAWGFEDACDA